MFCEDIVSPTFFLFSSEASKVLYYSHFFSLLASLGIGAYVYSKNRSSLAANALFLVAIFLSIWILIDVALWVNVDPGIIMFSWSFVNVFEMLTSLTTLYFSYVFLEHRDASLRLKLLGVALLLPYILMLPTSMNVASFDLPACEAVTGPATWYFNAFELVMTTWLLGYLAWKCFAVKGSNDDRRKVMIFAAGVVAFIGSFIGANLVASLTEEWNILFYGLFGVPIFVGLLAYLIVRYKAFDVKLLGAQALVLTLVFLTTSQLFFIRNITGIILAVITALLSLVFGWGLIRMIKREDVAREKLEAVTAQLSQTNEHLMRLDKARGEMLSIVAHQLRTPLTAMRGFLELVVEGDTGETVGPRTVTALNKVGRATDRLSQLVNNLLNMSRIDDGRMQYVMHTLDLTVMTREIAEIFDILAREKGLRLVLDMSPTPVPPITADEEKMHEVVTNLIHNAIKYTEKGSVTVRVWAESPRRVRVSVSDTGVGVPHDMVNRLFSKFTRADKRQLNTEGAGLGLYVCYNIVHDHGGRIWVESDGEGKGSTFIVELPAAPEDAVPDSDGADSA